MVKINLFHLMAWPHLDDQTTSWPVSGRYFDRARGPAVYRQYLDQLALADDLGFDWVACNEHHFTPYGLMASPTVMGAALSQRTRHVRIAMLGALAAINNPIRVAEEYAMLDNLSGGRLVAGLIRGGPHEHVGYGLNPDESRERFEEAVELILKCWTEPEPFGWEGRYYQYRTVSIWPRPVQQPHPPVYIAAGSEQSVRFAVKHRLGIAHAFVPLPVAAQQFDLYRQVAAQSGWTPPAENILFDEFIYVHPTSSAEAKRVAKDALAYFNLNLHAPTARTMMAVAQAEATRTGAIPDLPSGLANLERRYATSIDTLIENGTFCVGTPDEVVEQLRRAITTAGFGVVNGRLHMGNMPNDLTRASIELFATEVWPHVKDVEPDPTSLATRVSTFSAV